MSSSPDLIPSEGDRLKEEGQGTNAVTATCVHPPGELKSSVDGPS